MIEFFYCLSNQKKKTRDWKSYAVPFQESLKQAKGKVVNPRAQRTRRTPKPKKQESTKQTPISGKDQRIYPVKLLSAGFYAQNSKRHRCAHCV